MFLHIFDLSASYSLLFPKLELIKLEAVKFVFFSIESLKLALLRLASSKLAFFKLEFAMVARLKLICSI